MATVNVDWMPPITCAVTMPCSPRDKPTVAVHLLKPVSFDSLPRRRCAPLSKKSSRVSSAHGCADESIAFVSSATSQTHSLWGIGVGEEAWGAGMVSACAASVF
jgi:hypothetical protein